MSTALRPALLLFAGLLALALNACGGGSGATGPEVAASAGCPAAGYPEPASAGCPGAVYPEPASAGCPGAVYPEPASSLYVLPWQPRQAIRTGLTNCSSSFHSQGRPDQFAFDFDMAAGTPFVASRGGRVSAVVNDQGSQGGGAGNYVVIDHGDGSSGIYLHSPRGGIQVRAGDTVRQGQVLGISGRSGMAGYPHLHFMVVLGAAVYPYTGLPVSFRNADPPDRALRSSTVYRALP